MARKDEYEIKTDIEQLQKAADDIFKQAALKGRTLNDAEHELRGEILAKIDDLRAELALFEAPRPITQPGPVGQKGYATMTAKNPFNNLGTFAQAVASSMRPGSQIDHRLLDIQGAATGLNETTPSDGGFLVQTDFSDQLLRALNETGLIFPKVTRIPISGNANGIRLNAFDETSRATGSRFGGIRAYWIGEADEKTASKPKFRQMELNLKKLVGVCYATDELLADAAALERVLRQAFVNEFGFMLDDAIVNGSGAGQPLGILQSGCLVTVAAEGGQGADTVVWENVVKMFSRMPARHRKNAVWYINQDIEPQLFSMSLAVGTGGAPVYMPAGGASGAPYASLFGRPVVPIEQAAALGDVGDIIFADPTAYIMAEKGGIQSAMSIHVQFLYDESVFRFVMRVDGQPMYNSAITPYKGAADLSPFVALAAR